MLDQLRSELESALESQRKRSGEERAQSEVMLEEAERSKQQLEASLSERLAELEGAEERRDAEASLSELSSELEAARAEQQLLEAARSEREDKEGTLDQQRSELES